MKQVKKAVILAAGLGTRFLPITKAIPKEMLPIVDKPTIHYIVEEIVQSKIEHILIVVSSYKNSIIDYFDSAYELERRLSDVNKNIELTKVQLVAQLADIYYIRQKEPLGLGHAILMAEKFVGSDPFAVLTGDDLIWNDQNTQPAIGQCIELFHQTNQPVVGVQIVKDEFVNKHGIINPMEIDEKNQAILLKGIVEKPLLLQAPSNYGVVGRYVFTPDIFDYIKLTKQNDKNEIEITDALTMYLKNQPVYAKILQGKRFDIGSKLGLVEAMIFLSLKDETIKQSVQQLLVDYAPKPKPSKVEN